MLSVVCETYLNPFLVRTGTPIQIASKLVTLGLEMQGIRHTNGLVLHRFVILQYLFYNVSTKMA